jgi:tRNA pseudouridine55 synthase
MSYDFQAGEILLVDKPLGWTSFQTVNKIKHALKRKYTCKNFKVGHAGTLDPLASGLLVICTGKKTKVINSFIQEDKHYTGVIQLGATTPSFDLETSIDATFPTTHITPDLIEQIRKTFLGNQLQTPPVFSAKKIDGKRAYESARAGIDVVMKPNSVTIHKLELELHTGNELHFSVSCSKGTYIRSLAADIGKALQSGAHLIALRRIASGEFTIEHSKSIETWVDIINQFEVEEKKETTNK